MATRTKAPAIRRATYKGAFKSVGAQEDRIFQFTFSDGSVDRVGDTIDANGWDLKDYLKNPVVLWAHNGQTFPIGKCVRAWVEGAALKGQIQISTASAEAEQVFKHLLAGELNAVSVGFLPTEQEFAAETDERPYGIDFTKQALLEVSIVPVPANPNALHEPRTKSMATNKDQIEGNDAGTIKSMAEHVEAFGGHVKALGEHLGTLKGMLDRDAVDGETSGKAFAAALDGIAGLTSRQKAAIIKAAEQGHAMHPDIHKCVGMAHKSLTKALNLHNGAASADGDGAASHKPAGDNDNRNEDMDDDDEKAVHALVNGLARLTGAVA